VTELRPTDASPEGLSAVAGLLAACFPNVTHTNVEYLDWSYRRSPLGPSVGVDAWSNGELVGHAAGRLLEARLHGGESERGILIQHAAVRPGFRLRGLFVDLVDGCFAAGRARGASFAVAVPNRGSTPGAVKHLALEPVALLSVWIGIGPVPAGGSGPAADFEPARDPAWLAWRLARPAHPHDSQGRKPGTLPYQVRTRGAKSEIWAASGRLAIPVLLGEVPSERVPPGLPPPACTRTPLRAWVGLDPSRRRSGAWASVPVALRPSPLQLVFRDLSGGGRHLSAERVRFEALDFDAW
jgi:hypothetical protein